MFVRHSSRIFEIDFFAIHELASSILTELQLITLSKYLANWAYKLLVCGISTRIVTVSSTFVLGTGNMHLRY